MIGDKEKDVDLIEAVINAYTDRHISGGSFHIAFEDGNSKRSDIEWCTKQAEKDGDLIGVAIGKELLKAPEQVFQAACNVDWLYAFQVWKEIVREKENIK